MWRLLGCWYEVLTRVMYLQFIKHCKLKRERQYKCNKIVQPFRMICIWCTNASYMHAHLRKFVLCTAYVHLMHHAIDWSTKFFETWKKMKYFFKIQFFWSIFLKLIIIKIVLLTSKKIKLNFIRNIYKTIEFI